MKRITASLLCISMLFLFTGAVHKSAPVLQTKNYYVNDYSKVVFSEHRQRMLDIATELTAKTGIEVVVLTVNDLQGMAIEQFADATFDSWQIGGEEKKAALILFAVDLKQSFIKTGDGLSEIISPEEVSTANAQLMKSIGNGQFSTGVYNAFKTIVEISYTKSGIEPSEEIKTKLNAKGSPFNAGSMIVIVVIIVVIGRSIRVSMKYKKKYGNRYNPRHQDFTVKRREYDSMTEAEGSSRRDPHAYLTSEDKIRKEGFIIYRNEKDDADENNPL